MNIKTVLSVIFGIILLNNSLFTIIILPGMVSLLALIGATAILLVDGVKGGTMGKICMALGIVLGVFAVFSV